MDCCFDRFFGARPPSIRVKITAASRVAMTRPKTRCLELWLNSACFASQSTVERPQFDGESRTRARWDSPLPPKPWPPFLRPRLVCCLSMGGVDPKLRIRFPPRHFPDSRDRQGMGVPYSVTLLIRESRAKMKAKAESQKKKKKTPIGNTQKME
ncbi:hypothetical protein ACQKWADRAFT_278802 [Trichoderma austrokoningii]